MGTQVTILDQVRQARAKLPAHLQARLSGSVSKALGSGITAGFAVLSLRGKIWRIKYQGEEQTLYEPGTNNKRPAFSLNMVIVGAAETLSKVWYRNGYTEGANSPPDCWSIDARVPDPAAGENRQSPTCPSCRWNQWGSSRAQGGSGKGKDCADTKRLAVVPAGDVTNEMFGGPMLLRVPPASLAEVSNYANKLGSVGVNFFEVETTLSFDMTTEYPKIKFAFNDMLDADRLIKVIELQDTGVLARILSEPNEEALAHVVPPAPPPVPSPARPQAPPAGFKPTVVGSEPAPPPAPAPSPAPSPASADEPAIDPRLKALIDAGLKGKDLVDAVKALDIPVPEAAPPAPEPPAPAPELVPEPEPVQDLAPTPAPEPTPEVGAARKRAGKAAASLTPLEATVPPSEDAVLAEAKGNGIADDDKDFDALVAQLAL